MESNNIYTEVINSIPSTAMKQYISKHPIQLSVLQMATVVSYFSDNARTICAFKKLSRLTESPNEKELLLSAIDDIENNGSIGNHTQLIYERLFPHDGAPFFPFLERCYFPVLFSVNDKIMYKGESYIIKTKVFDKKKMEDYSKRAKEQWGQIAQYQEFEEKTKGVSDTQQKDVINRFMLIFTEFGKIKELDTSCDTVQLQVKKLQDFITENYYTCTKEILSGLGKMYASGGEFTENIDSYGGEGTALFTAKAIEIYCK